MNTRRTPNVTVEAIMENDGGVLVWTPSAIYFIAPSSLSTVSIALVDMPIDGKAVLAGGPNPSIRFELGSLDDVAPDFFLTCNERDATARRHHKK